MTLIHPRAFAVVCLSVTDTSCFVLLGMSVFSQQYSFFRADLVNSLPSNALPCLSPT